MIRTSEQIAPELLAELLAPLVKLTTAAPSTEDIEKAVALVPQLRQVLVDWVSSRHLIAANAHQAATFRERHPEIAAALDGRRPAASEIPATPTLTALVYAFTDRHQHDQADELDRIERAHPTTFSPDLTPMGKPA